MPVTAPKRKIKAKLFVKDLRDGVGDRELMEKYTLSEGQLHKVFRRLVDAGLIDEMELFMRTSLSDSTFTKAFVVTQCSVQECDNLEEITPPREVETPSQVAMKEKLSTTSGVFGRIFSKLAGTGS
jgi:hypothetical protein